MSWDKVKLTDISRPKQWKTISTAELKSDGYPVYGANGKIGFYDEYTHEFPTLLITCRGATCGTLNISEPKSYVNGNAMALDNLSESVNLKFLFYALNKRGLHDTISGSAQPQITREGLSNVELRIPPLPTQKAIAEKLDKADALRKKDQELQKSYDELAQSVFIEMFGDPVRNEKGWEIKNFVDFTENITKGESPKWQGYTYVESGVRFITSENVLMGEIDISENKTKFIPEEFHNKLKRSQLKADDFLINLVGASIGRCAILKEDLLPANINQAVASIRIKKGKLNLVYCLYLFLSEAFQDVIKGNIVEAARANISLGNIRNFQIPIPPLPLQQKFAQIIENIEVQKALVKQQAEESENLFQSLLQESFN